MIFDYAFLCLLINFLQKWGNWNVNFCIKWRLLCVMKQCKVLMEKVETFVTPMLLLWMYLYPLERKWNIKKFLLLLFGSWNWFLTKSYVFHNNSIRNSPKPTNQSNNISFYAINILSCGYFILGIITGCWCATWI